MDFVSVSASPLSPPSGGNDSVASLEAQKAALERKIAEEKASTKDDEKTKQQKIAQYTQQMQQLEAKI